MTAPPEPTSSATSDAARARAKENEAVWVLTGFRLLLGVWLAAAAFISGHFRGPLGYSDVLCAAVLIVVALLTRREPRGRYVLIPLAVWIGLSPFVLKGMTLVSFLNEALIAKTLIFSSAASWEMFEE